MRFTTHTLRAFLRHEAGAVTVDWTTLSAGATGLALATGAVFSGAFGDMSAKMNRELFTNGTTNGIYGFEFGTGGWEGVETAFVEGFGHVLGPIGGSEGAPAVATTVAVPEDIASVTLSFDVLAFDSIDSGEEMVLYLDGVEIGRVGGSGRMTFTGEPPEGVTVGFEALAHAEDIGGSRDTVEGGPSYWRDGMAAMSITIDDPGDAVTLSVGSTTNQDVQDEAWGIDNWDVTGTWADEGEAAGAAYAAEG